MNAWKPIIERFGLRYATVEAKDHIYTMVYAEQVVRCADDDARVLILRCPR
jgi:hypothetical protein